MSLRLIDEKLLSDTLEAIKASELDMFERDGEESMSAKYLGELRNKLEDVLDVGKPEEGDPTDEEYVKAAQDIHQEDGVIEVDDGAIVSRSPMDQGAYVLAWVWVYKTDVDEKYKENECELCQGLAPLNQKCFRHEEEV